MTSRIRSVVLTLSVIAAGLAGAVVIEHAAIAHGQQLAHDDAGSGSAAVAAVVIVPPAPAAPVVVPLPQTTDPLSTLGELVQDARTGKGRLVLGSAIVLFVWGLRSLLAKRIKWFSTPAGGYLLGFGIPAILYIGGAVAGGVAVTLNLICDAAVAGFAAAGKWEALRDLITKMGAPVVKSAAITAFVAVFGVGATVSLATSCKGDGALAHAGNTIVDCSKPELASAVSQLLGDLEQLARSGGHPDWAAIEAQAVSHGLEIGGCALAQFTEHILAPKAGVAAPSPDVAQHAHDTLEHFRATTAKGATFHTADGDL